MVDVNEPIWAHVKRWHPLTEIPERVRSESPGKSVDVAESRKAPASIHPPLADISPGSMKLVFDGITYLHSDVSTRIKRLNMSARLFEIAKREALEHGYLLESSAGQTLYLIPTKKAYAAFYMEDPYERAASIEHAFYVNGLCYLLKQDPRLRSVVVEAKIGHALATADAMTTAHDGVRQAWELTLSTGNVLANAAKYIATDVARITFVCRDYKLSQAVKACCREGGLDPDVLSKLDYMHWGLLLRRQRNLYQHRG